MSEVQVRRVGPADREQTSKPKRGFLGLGGAKQPKKKASPSKPPAKEKPKNSPPLKQAANDIERMAARVPNKSKRSFLSSLPLVGRLFKKPQLDIQPAPSIPKRALDEAARKEVEEIFAAYFNGKSPRVLAAKRLAPIKANEFTFQTFALHLASPKLQADGSTVDEMKAGLLITHEGKLLRLKMEPMYLGENDDPFAAFNAADSMHFFHRRSLEWLNQNRHSTLEAMLASLEPQHVPPGLTRKPANAMDFLKNYVFMIEAFIRKEKERIAEKQAEAFKKAPSGGCPYPSLAEQSVNTSPAPVPAAPAARPQHVGITPSDLPPLAPPNTNKSELPSLAGSGPTQDISANPDPLELPNRKP